MQWKMEGAGRKRTAVRHQAASLAIHEVSGTQESVVRARDTYYHLSPALLMMLCDLTGAERGSPAVPRRSSFAP